MSQPDISIVIPMKNEEDGVPSLFSRLLPIMDCLNRPYEIICVNDGSTDSTVAALIGQQRSHPQIVVVDLSRNFGKEAALTAGIAQARGNAVIPLDADLQDPPELIPEMIAKWEAGAEVVLALRRQRQSDTFFKRLSANAFYWLINKLSDITIPPHAGDFRLMDRAVVDALAALPERTRFNKGIFAWLGFGTSVVEYERPERQAGTTKWASRRLWSFAIDGITSFSSVPLRIWSYIGALIALSSLVYGLAIIIRVLVFDAVDVPGYASLMTAILFSCGITLIGLGAIGEYLSRIFIEVKQRPLYIVRSVYTNAGEED